MSHDAAVLAWLLVSAVHPHACGHDAERSQSPQVCNFWLSVLPLPHTLAAALHMLHATCVARVRAWPCRGAKLRAAASVRSIQRGRQRSGTASQRAYPDCVARAWGRPASKKTADARLICIPIIIRVGRASRSSRGGRFPSVPAVLAVAALPLLGAAFRHAACARGRHCRSCSLHVVHVHA